MGFVVKGKVGIKVFINKQPCLNHEVKEACLLSINRLYLGTCYDSRCRFICGQLVSGDTEESVMPSQRPTQTFSTELVNIHYISKLSFHFTGSLSLVSPPSSKFFHLTVSSITLHHKDKQANLEYNSCHFPSYPWASVPHSKAPFLPHKLSVSYY